MDRADCGDARLQQFHLRFGVALDLAPEPGPVRNDEPKVPDLWTVHAGPVNLVEDPVADGEPRPLA
jgi:hypothetical protein